MEDSEHTEQNHFNGGSSCAGDNNAAADDITSQLTRTISLQQQQIDSLSEQLKSALARIDTLESSVKGSQSSGAMSARAGVRSAPPASNRRKTMDPKAMSSARNSASEDQLDGAAASKKRSYNVTTGPPKRLLAAAKDRQLAPIKDKEEPGTYRMYLQGRPVTFRLPEGYTQPANAEPSAAPEQNLKIDFVHGYRGRDCRNNVWMLGSGEIVYFTAAVCVVQNVETREQRHYLEHTDDVKCIAVHPDKVIVASGQVAGHEKPAKGKGSKAAATNPKFMPHIRIWDSKTMETLKVVGAGNLDRAVACLSFSVTDKGQHLCAVDEHNDHRMFVWDWNKGPKGTKLAEAKCSQDAVYQADFHPTDANQIVCCGKNQLSFWSLDGKNLSKKMALFEKQEKPKFITCLTFTPDGAVVTGDSNGSLIVWARGSNKIGSIVSNAHDGVVFCVYVNENGSLVSGGGKDNCLKVWDLKNKEAISSVEIPPEFGSARVCLQTGGDDYIIGTTKNTIMKANLSDISQAHVLTQGHHGELWGIAESSNQPNKFYTCSYDNSLKLWDVNEKKVMWSIDLPESLHCVAVNPSGELLAVGSRTPNWFIYNTETKEQVASGNCGSEQLECVEFSPDGSYLAFGSRDNSIYVYKMEDGKPELVGKCQGHSSFVTHIDWSTDNKYIRSNSGDYELLYWEVPACKQYTESSIYKSMGDDIRQLEFSTQSCVLSLDTVGMWPKGADGTDINGCCVNHSRTLLASADDFGKVNLYSYPSRTPEAKGNSYSGHSSHVTNVKFTSSDQYLLSVGGKDSTVIQWSVC